MRSKHALERKDLDGLPLEAKLFAHGLGRVGLEAAGAGVWVIAEGFKGRPQGRGSPEADRIFCVKRLLTLMDEAARTCDGSKLRLLAYAVEQRKRTRAHDPLRATLALMKLGQHPLMTASKLQDALRHCYAKNELPDAQTIRKIAKGEFALDLPRNKAGAPKGARRKAGHRALR